MKKNAFLGLWMVAAMGCAGAEARVERPGEAKPEPGTTPPDAVTPAPSAPPAAAGDGFRLARIEVEDEIAGGSTSRTTLRYFYDGAGRLVRKDRGHGSAVSVTTSYGYDDAGRLLSESTSTGLATGQSTVNTYDAQGRLTRQCSTQSVGILAVMPNDSCTFYDHDAKGRVVREQTVPGRVETRPADQSNATDVSYVEDQSGNVVEERRGRGQQPFNVKTIRRDASGRIVEETFDALHTPELEERKVYERAADGSIRKLVLTRGGAYGSGVAEYEYNGGRVVRATGALPPGESFAHAVRSVARYTYEKG